MKMYITKHEALNILTWLCPYIREHQESFYSHCRSGFFDGRDSFKKEVENAIDENILLREKLLCAFNLNRSDF